MLLLVAVESRIFRIGGKRVPLRLRRDDLPDLTRALIAVIRKRARAGVVAVQDVRFVHLTGRNVDVMVPAEDWKLIMPAIQAEAFNPNVFPAGPAGRPRDPTVAYDEPVLDQADKLLYEKIFGSLAQLFTERFPTRPF